MSTNTDELTFEALETTDVISVELVPERKGLILKHCEYYVSSRRHGTTVSRRYNEFVQLYDVLYAKYPYRAVCSLPPKRVVVGGGSPLFLQRRCAALQRWLTLVARHPVLAHDADLRTFLCETNSRLEKPKHDEFILAGTQEDNMGEMSTDEMQEAFVSEQEQLRLVQLGLGRLFKIIEKVESRCESERADIRELGAALSALCAPTATDDARWARMRDALRAAAQLATEMGESTPELAEDEAMDKTLVALDALGAHRRLCGRLTRGLHAERAAAAAAAPHSAAARALRARHRYALRCVAEVGRYTGAGRALVALDALGAYRRLCGRLTRGLHAERAAAAAAAPHSAAARALRARHRYALRCVAEVGRYTGAGRALVALDALGAYRRLCGRLTRGLHAERAAAAAAAPHSAAARALRARHRYALRCVAEVGRYTGAGRALVALDALGAYRRLCGRLTRGLHAERAAAAAAAAAPHSAAARALRARHRYALRCVAEVGRYTGAGRALVALDALGAYRRLCGRLTRGLHAERAAAAAAAAPHSAAARALRARHRYALRCVAEVGRYTGAGRALVALDALGAHRRLCGRLTRGLHAERAAAAAAAAAAPHSAAARALRSRHRYALRCAAEEARLARVYALAALEALPELLRARGAAHALAAALWADLHAALRHPHYKQHK